MLGYWQGIDLRDSSPMTITGHEWPVCFCVSKGLQDPTHKSSLFTSCLSVEGVARQEGSTGGPNTGDLCVPETQWF